MRIELTLKQVLFGVILGLVSFMWVRAEFALSDSNASIRELVIHADKLADDNKILARQWGTEFAARSVCLQSTYYFAGILSDAVSGTALTEVSGAVKQTLDLLKVFVPSNDPIDVLPQSEAVNAIESACGE